MLLMDEPFGALDALTRRQMQELLTRIWEEHRLTVLFVTHDVEEAVYLSDRVVVMGIAPGCIKRTFDWALGGRATRIAFPVRRRWPCSEKCCVRSARSRSRWRLHDRRSESPRSDRGGPRRRQRCSLAPKRI